MFEVNHPEDAVGRGYNVKGVISAMFETFPSSSTVYSICPICGEDPLDCKGHKSCDVCGESWTECRGHEEGESIHPSDRFILGIMNIEFARRTSPR
jgi:hypothetical protein